MVKSFGGNNQENLSEYAIDKELLNIIIASMQKYYDDIQKRIMSLENVNSSTVSYCSHHD